VSQVTPLVSHPTTPRPKIGRNLTAGEVSDDTGNTYGFANTGRVQPCPFWHLTSTGTTSPWSGCFAAVERGLTMGKGAQSQGKANAPTNASKGGKERENRASREVAGAPTHSGELYRARGAHRARLSASTRRGRTRRS